MDNNNSMKLETYLKTNKLAVASFAKSIGVLRYAVYSYFSRDGKKPKKFPSPETMQKIVVVTNGAVTPNDFYDLPAKEG